MPDQVLTANEYERHGDRTFLRLMVMQDALIVVVLEWGPPGGADVGQERVERLHAWMDQREPPTVIDDVGTAYLAPFRQGVDGKLGIPAYPDFPMKATVSWRFLPVPRPEVRSWTIDGHWTVERSEA